MPKQIQIWVGRGFGMFDKFHTIKGSHMGIFNQPHVVGLADKVRSVLNFYNTNNRIDKKRRSVGVILYAKYK